MPLGYPPPIDFLPWIIPNALRLKHSVMSRIHLVIRSQKNQTTLRRMRHLTR